jgi:hypothetical protein
MHITNYSPYRSVNKYVWLRNILIVVTFLLLVSAFWRRYGMNGGDTADGWMTFRYADERGLLPLPLDRPFVYIFVSLAHWLTPDSFVGVNFLMASAFLLKGSLLYGLLRRLRVNVAYAFAAATLFICFPADTGQFWQGAIAIQFTLILYMVAAYWLLAYWHRARWYYIIGMSLALFISLTTYEAGYPLALLTPLILLLLNRRLDRRLLKTAGIWYTALGLTLVFVASVALVLKFPYPYQSSLLEARPTVQQILESLVNNYTLHFTWIQNVTRSPSVTLAIGLALICWWLSKMYSPTAKKLHSPAFLAVLTLVGLVALGVGFAAYLPTSLRTVSVRTFYYSSIGGAITLTMIVALITSLLPLRIRRIVFAAVMAIVISFGASKLILSHGEFVNAYNRQVFILASIVQYAPRPDLGATIILIDKTSDGRLINVFNSSRFFNGALTLIYRDYSLNAALCFPNKPQGWGYHQEVCRFSADGISVETKDVDQFSVSQRYSKVILFRYTANGEVQLERNLSAYISSPISGYEPDKIAHPEATPPRRYYTMLGAS